MNSHFLSTLYLQYNQVRARADPRGAGGAHAANRHGERRRAGGGAARDAAQALLGPPEMRRCLEVPAFATCLRWIEVVRSLSG